MKKPRIIWLAKTDVDAYADLTEPTLYPHGFTELVEKKYYDALEIRFDNLKTVADTVTDSLFAAEKERDSAKAVIAKLHSEYNEILEPNWRGKLERADKRIRALEDENEHLRGLLGENK